MCRVIFSTDKIFHENFRVATGDAITFVFIQTFFLIYFFYNAGIRF